MLNKKIVLLFTVVCCYTSAFSQSKVSNQSGGWSNPAIWTPTGVPTSTDNVSIVNGHTVSIGASGSCSNLIVGTGGVAAVLQFTGNTARTMTVNGDINISSASVFSIVSNSNATHSVVLGGNLVNNGTFLMFTDNNSICNFVFNKNGNQNISGSGSLTRFNRIQLNMGTLASNILEVTSTSFTTSSNFLVLSNGTFKLSSPANSTLVPFTAATTVAATAGLWLNSASSILSCSASLSYSGQVTVSNGTLFIGNANNEDLTPRGGTLSISGGSVVIAGKYNASNAATTFSMSGGIMRISNNASTNTGIAPFHISVSGSVFNMTGGTIVLRREGGNGAQDLGYLNTGATSGAVTGGTLQFGDNTSPAAQNIRINSTYSVPTLVVNSASVTVTLNTNSLAITNNVSILNGTLTSNNLNLSVGGNWNNISGTFNPGNATVIFNSNGAQTIFKTGGATFSHLLFSGGGIKTFGSAITTTGNFSINPGSAVDVSSSNFSLTIAGNFLNDGSFIQRNGTVLFNGALQQNISGSASTTFYNLTLNNNAGATLGNAQSFEGTLQLNNGTLNTNGQLFTLISNSLTTGRVGSILGTGNMTGNMTVQRHAPGGLTGWALWGSPLSSALTFNDWDDDIYISCPSCPDGYVPGFSSVYSYDESVAGSYSTAASYISLNSINDAVVTGKGYWVYLGNGQINTTDIITDVTGIIQKFNYAIPLNYSNSGSASDDGWNLITNPYPSSISWALLKGATANIDDAVYAYNADLNAGAGGFASYVNGISSPDVASGGINDNIPMCQGFYVHSTGATSLQATESVKVNNNPTFLKPNTAATHTLIRLNISSFNGLNDETVLYFEPNGTKNFEAAYDAYKMASFDPNVPIIAINQGTLDFQVNGVAPFAGTFSISVKALTNSSGNFTINPTELLGLPKGACITLYDKVTATTTNLRNNNYSFYLSDTTIAPRFVLNITINSLNANTKIQQPTCSNPNEGYVVAKGTNQGSWNYYWSQNGTVVKTSLNINAADTLKNLSGGSYDLEINTVGQCDNYESVFFITAQSPVTSLFSGPDTVLLSQASSVLFTNQSQNSVGQNWLSNSQTLSSEDAIFNYSAPGNYKVNLQSISSSGCLDSSYKNLHVKDDLTDLKSLPESTKFIVKTLGNNVFEISGAELSNKATEVKLFDLTGKQIKSYRIPRPSSILVDLSPFPLGVYIVSFFNNNYSIHSLKLVAE